MTDLEILESDIQELWLRLGELEDIIGDICRDLPVLRASAKAIINTIDGV